MGFLRHRVPQVCPPAARRVPRIPPSSFQQGLRTAALPPPASQLTAVALARFVLVPLGSFGLLQAALRLRLLPVDPLRDFMILLQTCMPPAQNTVLALQVAPRRRASV